MYVRSVGVNQSDETVLTYTRWVMVRKRNTDAPAPEPVIPNLPAAVPAEDLVVPEGLDLGNYDAALAGSPHL